MFIIDRLSFCYSNYHEDNEGLINRQINLEMYASYAYTAMAHYFDRHDVALKGRENLYKYDKKKNNDDDAFVL